MIAHANPRRTQAGVREPTWNAQVLQRNHQQNRTPADVGVCVYMCVVCDRTDAGGSHSLFFRKRTPSRLFLQCTAQFHVISSDVRAYVPCQQYSVSCLDSLHPHRWPTPIWTWGGLPLPTTGGGVLLWKRVNESLRHQCSRTRCTCKRWCQQRCGFVGVATPSCVRRGFNLSYFVRRREWRREWGKERGREGEGLCNCLATFQPADGLMAELRVERETAVCAAPLGSTSASAGVFIHLHTQLHRPGSNRDNTRESVHSAHWERVKSCWIWGFSYYNPCAWAEEQNSINLLESFWLITFWYVRQHVAKVVTIFFLFCL